MYMHIYIHDTHTCISIACLECLKWLRISSCNYCDYFYNTDNYLLSNNEITMKYFYYRLNYFWKFNMQIRILSTVFMLPRNDATVKAFIIITIVVFRFIIDD